MARSSARFYLDSFGSRSVSRWTGCNAVLLALWSKCCQSFIHQPIEHTNAEPRVTSQAGPGLSCSPARQGAAQPKPGAKQSSEDHNGHGPVARLLPCLQYNLTRIYVQVDSTPLQFVPPAFGVPGFPRLYLFFSTAYFTSPVASSSSLTCFCATHRDDSISFPCSLTFLKTTTSSSSCPKKTTWPRTPRVVASWAARPAHPLIPVRRHTYARQNQHRTPNRYVSLFLLSTSFDFFFTRMGSPTNVFVWMCASSSSFIIIIRAYLERKCACWGRSSFLGP